MPKISVLMTVRNNEKYIEESVESILAQSYRDFEFLIVDDASTDATYRKLENLAQRDSRIALRKNQINLGVAGSLNLLIDEADGEYLARMDGDDIAVIDRFERQVRVLDSGQADICGGWVAAFGKRSEAVMKFPVEDAAIRTQMVFFNPFCHPTILMKRELLQVERYNENMKHVEDYDLWQRLSGMAKMHNLPHVILLYRRHANQAWSLHSDEQIEGSAQLAVQYLDRIGMSVSERERELHSKIRNPKPPVDWLEVRETERWLLRLAAEFEKDQAALEVIADQWYRYCLKSASKGVRAYSLFLKSPLRRLGNFRAWQKWGILLLGVMRVRYGSDFYSFLVSHSPAAKVRK